MEEQYDLLVVGGGPAGYVGAIRASKLGMKVALVESAKVGGTCLHEGCIPTKVLLEVAGFMAQAARSGDFGVAVGSPTVDWGALSHHRESIVNRLFLGVQGLLKKNRVDVFSGEGHVVSPEEVVVSGDGQRRLSGTHILVATGSRPRSWPGLPFDHQRVLDSTDALCLEPSGKKIGIVGGGVVGVEFADIFHSFGASVTILEKTDHLVPMEDPELLGILRKEYERRGMVIRTGCEIARIVSDEQGVRVSCVQGGEPVDLSFDTVLVAVGREARLEGVVDGSLGLPMERGFLKVDGYGWTGVSRVYAAGDVTGGLMLAHAASHQAIVAVEKMAGRAPLPFDPLRIPRVVYSHPEVVSVGMSYKEAIGKGIPVREGSFPLLGNGRSLIHGEKRGVVRFPADPESGKVLGFQGVGAGLSELVSLGALSMGVPDGLELLRGTVFPHPTVGESIWEAAMDVTGESVHR